MPLDPKQQRFLARFYPGLLEAVAALGSGEFEAHPPQLKTIGDDCIRHAYLRLKYALADGMVVDIRIQPTLRPEGVAYRCPPNPGDVAPVDLTQYRVTYYSMHYGPRLADSIFRFDLNEWGAHVHIAPDVREHVPAEQAEPDTRDLDPRIFVGMVEQYRATNIHPVKRKNRP